MRYFLDLSYVIYKVFSLHNMDFSFPSFCIDIDVSSVLCKTYELNECSSLSKVVEQSIRVEALDQFVWELVYSIASPRLP